MYVPLSLQDYDSFICPNRHDLGNFLVTRIIFLMRFESDRGI